MGPAPNRNAGPASLQAAASPPSKVTLSGVGSGGNSPVIGISGNSRVTLRNLEIRNGNVPLSEFGGSGGGISFFGSGTLAIDNVTVAQNFAGFGGGISVTGSGAPAELRLGSNVLITGNTAQFDGGGVRIDGTTRLFMLGDASGIIFNHARGANGKGFGGGLEVVGPAIADIGSPGYFGLGAIYLNDALNGGGVAVVADKGDASVRFFSVDGTRPVRVQGNTAAQSGGGVFVKPFSDGSAPQAFGMATMCASDFRITDNVATDGAGIFADVDTAAGGTKPWSVVVLNRPSTAQSMCPFPEPPTSLGAVPCATGVLCNSIDANATLAPDGTETPGSTVLVQGSSFLYADRVRLSRNQSSHAVRVNAGTGRLELTNSLLFGNIGGHFATNASGGGETVFTQADTVLDGCTFSRNGVGNIGPVVAANAALTLRRSIFDQHEVKNLAFTGPASGLVVSHVMAITSLGLPAGPTMLFGQDPKFVNSDADDFHLQPTSPALDFAPISTPDQPVDLDGLPRNQNLSTVTDRFGPRDLGAYERQP
jgi:hypothetical protein